MPWTYRLLLLLSRHANSHDYTIGEKEWTPRDPLLLLRREFPDFDKLVSGRRVADYGCGAGHQSIALAQQCACQVVGIDSNPLILQQAEQRAHSLTAHRSQLSFVKTTSVEMHGRFDVVLSQNSFEHFRNPQAALGEMAKLAKPEGKILITFGPPWYAPYGSHMRFFCKVPWINILFSERAVMTVRTHFRTDGATAYEQVEAGLNKMSLAKYERIVMASGLRVEYQRYRGVWGMDFVSRIGGIRELLTNRVTASLLTANNVRAGPRSPKGG